MANRKRNAPDILHSLDPIVRRWVRGVVAVVLSFAVDGVVMGIQTIILPDLKTMVGDDIYQTLYTMLFVGSIATLQAWSKWLRSNKGQFLPF